MDLKPNGSEIMVTNENKREYIEYVPSGPVFIKSSSTFGGRPLPEHLVHVVDILLTARVPFWLGLMDWKVWLVS